MVTGRPPFRANGTLAVLKRVAEDTPRPIREIIPEMPQWLCDIIAKLHAKNPDDRFQSAREVADVLADCEAQLKANSKLKDFSRIPKGNAKPARRMSALRIAVAIGVPALLIALVAIAVYHGVKEWRCAATITGPQSPMAKICLGGAGSSTWPPIASSNIKPGDYSLPFRLATTI